MLHLPENIRLIRDTAKKTQLDFAQIFGIIDRNGNYSTDKVWTYEKGKANPTENLIKKIADFAGVDVEDLKNKRLTEADIIVAPHHGSYSSTSTVEEPKDLDILALYRQQLKIQELLLEELQEIKTSLKTISTTLSSSKVEAEINLNPVEGEQDVSGNRNSNKVGVNKSG